MVLVIQTWINQRRRESVSLAVKLVIDECLHTSPTDVANKAGFERHHVNRRGWSGLIDRELFDLIAREEFVLVTNNTRDFRKLIVLTR